MASKLVVADVYNPGQFRIHWELDDDFGGHLCQSESDGAGDPPSDRDDWEHWAASRAVRNAKGVSFDGLGAYWTDEKLAADAARIARAAIKQDRPLPGWAEQAIAAGWKPPKGWKP